MKASVKLALFVLVFSFVLISPVFAKPMMNLKAHLAGRNEVPNSIDTRAQGQVIFMINKDETMISYKLIVANIENVLQAHIHIAPEGVNGPVVVWLYPSGPPPILILGRSDGVLAEGTITAASLVGPLAGQESFGLLQ